MRRFLFSLLLGACSAGSSSSSSLEQEVQNAFTNHNGEVFFMEQASGEEFPVRYVDEHRQPVSGAAVTFVEGPDLAAFEAVKSGHVASFDALLDIHQPNGSPSPARELELEFILPSGSFHAFTLFEYDHDTHPQQTTALESFYQWGQDGRYAFRDCLTKEEMLAGRNRTSALIRSIGSANIFYQIFNFVVGKLLDLEEEGLHQEFRDEAYDLYTPIRNFTLPEEYQGHPLFAREISGNTIDDNCNGRVDEYSSGESGQDGQDSDEDDSDGSCTPHARRYCSGNSVYWQDSCGGQEERIQDCTSSETCQEGYCVRTGCLSHADLICSGGDAYWADSCGNPEELFEDCLETEVCEGGQCW